MRNFPYEDDIVKPTIVLTALALCLSACGPVHPRWKNDSAHDIRVTYYKGPAHYGVFIKSGRENVPVAPFDFQTVDRIDIEDSGQTQHLTKAIISKMHADCGHGYSCRIRYDDDHKLEVAPG